jgi:chromosome partitioning protein
MLTLNGLCAAHGVIIPMQCEYYALEGLSDLVNTIKKVHANLNRDLKIIGLLRVMFDPRSTLSNQVSAQLDSISATRCSDHRAAQRAAGRGAQLRHSRRAVRQGGQGCAGLLAFAVEMIERVKTVGRKPT